MSQEKNKKISIRQQGVAWFFVFLMSGSFLFGEKVLAVNDYTKATNLTPVATSWNNIISNYDKPLNGTLSAFEWNGLANDFVKTWATSTMVGPLGIDSTNPAAMLDVSGNVKITSGGTVYNTDNSRWLDMTGVLSDSLKVSGNLITTGGKVGVGTASPTQQLEITKNFSLPSTLYTNGSYGVIYKGGNRFIHDFNYGNNGSVTTVGYNTFVGIGSGNFTMGSTATSVSHASYNTGIGYQSLSANTIGYQNSALGFRALYNNTTGTGNNSVGFTSLNSNATGSYNNAFGSGTLYTSVAGHYGVAVGYESQRYANSTTTTWTNSNTSVGHQTLRGGTDATLNTGTGNAAFGYQALLNNTSGGNNIAIGYATMANNNIGSNNTAVGYQALYANTSGTGNNAFGYASLISNTTGSYNTAMGHNAGRYLADGTTGRTTGNYGVYLGYNTKAFSNGTTNEIVIGQNVIGLGSNTVVLGNDSIITTALKGNIGIGTTTPTAKLDVNGLIKMRNYTITQPEDVINKSYLDSALASSTSEIITQVATSSLWQGNLAGNIYSNNTGNVGIGTSTPGYKLDVSVANNPAVARFRSEINSASTNVVIDAGLAGNPNSSQSNLVFAGNGTAYWTLRKNFTNHNFSIIASNNNPVLTIENNAAANSLYIQSTGNVGIGTTNPGAFRLNVVPAAGSNGVYITNVAGNYNSLLVDNNNADYKGVLINHTSLRGGGNCGGDGCYGFKFDDKRFNNLSAGYGPSFVITRSGTTTVSNLFQVDSHGVNGLAVSDSGYVGIGTTAPDVRLDVEGGANTYGTNIYGIWTPDGNSLIRNWALNDGSNNYGAAGQGTYTSITDAPMGSKTMRYSVSTQWRNQQWIPVDITKTYKVSVWGRTVSGTPNNYLSLTQATSDLSQPANGGWGNPYWGRINEAFPAAWTYYTMTIGPSGSGANYAWTSTTRYVQLGALMIYTGSGVAEITGYKIEEVPSTLAATSTALGNFNVVGTVTAGGFSGPMSGSLNSANVSAGTFGANTGGGDYHFPSNVYLDGNYGKSIVGLYSATRYQGVYAMGDAYKLAADGATPGTLYGIAWTHSNVGGQSKSGLQHQALFMTNGVTQTAIGTGIWTLGGYTQSGSTANTFTGTVTAPTFIGALSGNATTASSLSANPANCAAGNYPLGIAANGTVESCTADLDTQDLGISGNTITLVNGGSVTAPYATSAGNVGSVGYGSNSLTYFQTSGDFASSTGWSHYIISNHGDGATYYNYILKLPFWGVPQYRRQTGSVSNVTSWYDFLTAENYSTYALPTANVSGTTNYLSKFTGSKNLANSLLYDNGTNVGIGTTTPGSKLTVVGAVSATSFSGSLSGSLNAANVASGTFGSNTGGGNYTFPGTVTATTFIGALNGNATSATNADTLDAQHGSYYDQRVYNSATNYLGGGYISGGAEKPNWAGFGAGKLKLQMLSGSNIGAPDGWNDVLWMSSYTGGDVKGSNALIFSKYNDRVGFVRQDYDSASWGTYREFITSANIGSQSVNYATSAGSAGILTGAAKTNGSDGWFRSTGPAGWFNETYSVGVYATQAGRVDLYNGAGLYVPGAITAGSRITAPAITVSATGGTWLSGKTGTDGLNGTQQTTGSYHPLIRQTTSSGHVVNLGGLGNSFGFYGYDVNRTVNGTDYAFTMNLSDGSMNATNNLNVGGSINVGGALNVTGTVTAAGFTGPFSGTVNASNVSAGTFGSAGGGNYTFPGTVTATTFIGALSGNATNSNACSADGNCDLPGSGIWNSSGYVGISTVSPGTNLTVNSSANGQGGAHGVKLRTNSYAGTAFVGFDFNTNSANTSDYDSSFRIQRDDTVVAKSQNMIFMPGNGTTPTERMRIVGANGNVGIGTTNPGAYKLNVTGGNIYGSGNLTLGGGSIITSTGVNLMLTPGGGNVGIGVSPSYQLHVSGEIHSNDRVSAPTICVGSDCRGAWPTAPSSSDSYGTDATFNSVVATSTTATTSVVRTLTVRGGTGNTVISRPTNDLEFSSSGLFSNYVVANGGSSNMGVYASGGWGYLKSSSDNLGISANQSNPSFVMEGPLVGIGQNAAVSGDSQLYVSNATSSVTYAIKTKGAIYAAGLVYSNGSQLTSDRSLKNNIETINNPIEKIMKLRGVSFDWKDGSGSSLGVIAQELKSVFPELVKGEEGGLSVNYDGLIAPLIEAVKAQQLEIKDLQSKIKILETQR